LSASVVSTARVTESGARGDDIRLFKDMGTPYSEDAEVRIRVGGGSHGVDM
jgi:hypothetical protein